MANTQGEFGLPTPDDDKRQSARFLPRFFRSEANLKFLQATIDQLIQPGVAEKLSGYVGRKTAKGFRSTDTYIPEISIQRQSYQLEPGVVIKDNVDNVKFFKDYNDFINQLKFFNVDTSDHSVINEQESYPWNPNIDWDKFVNFREYYWLPNGPLSVPVEGQSEEVTSTYTITAEDQGGNYAYVFSNRLARNPSVKLFRGQKYRFEIDCPHHPIAIAITRSFTPGNAVIVATQEGIRNDGLFDAELFGAEFDAGDFIILPEEGGVTFEDSDNVSTLYPDGIKKLGDAGEEIANIYMTKGAIEFTVPYNAPNKLYYINSNDIDMSGEFRIYDIEENTYLNVRDEIVGAKTYSSANGVKFTNGLKVFFRGQTTPEYFAEGNYYVDGVGTSIQLIAEDDLILPQAYTATEIIEYDTDKFDRLPYSTATGYPALKDYVTINRASADGNAWARSNRWFHKSVIEQSAIFNNFTNDVDETTKASRPIIEFEPGLHLYHYGTEFKKDIDLIDTFTTDVFSTIEGSKGYNIDGVDLVEGMRVLFTADTDIRVTGKIYEVKFVRIVNDNLISLIETNDTLPLENENVLVKQGTKNKGKVYFYRDGWKEAQEKTKINQPPMFALYSPSGDAFSDMEIYNSSTFTGTKLFSYKQGTGTVDSELGFPLSYRNIDNTGDILFDFNLESDSFTYQLDETTNSIFTKTGFLKKYISREKFKYANGWSSIPYVSKQPVVREYQASINQQTSFEIDVYDNATNITDLNVKVFVNNIIQNKNLYTLIKNNNRLIVEFSNNVEVGDLVVIKTQSSTAKNENGYYEFPINLEKNPLNADVSTFTLGEVNDHVKTMIDDLNDFDGVYPGYSNLKDLGDLDRFGKRFVKHSGPLNLPMYLTLDKKYNIIKSIEYSMREYNKFKRNFLQTSETLGFDGEVKQHVDVIIKELNKDKTKTQPFYFSDMIGYKGHIRNEYVIFDDANTYYPLSTNFNLKTLNTNSVLVYFNGEQLIHNKDYIFTDESFLQLLIAQQINDVVEVYEYNNTDGSYVPPTPTKLGLYPSYEPQIVRDDEWLSNQNQINTADAYQLYGQNTSSKKVGWFHPLYVDRSAAKLADSNGEVTQVEINGSSRIYFAPKSSYVCSKSASLSIPVYPIGKAIIIGHDGSRISAYEDYRDNLLLELEKRIFNNIKSNYNANIFNKDDFVSGKFRKGITKSKLDRILLKDFITWNTNIGVDYTSNKFYFSQDQFTFNYSKSTSSIDGAFLPGYWRGVFLELYDTDRPHTHPWEMLGLTIKPKWWEDTYGKAPYTSNNNILWKDLEEGRIKDPNLLIQVNEKYARPGLTSIIPVDSQGHLLSPISCGYAKNTVLRDTNSAFKFGDNAPVEAAWRNSSEYPFSLVKAMLLNQPAKFLALGFDVSRTTKNLANQIVYSNTGRHVELENLIFPNTYEDTTKVLTSGVVNFIHALIGSNVLKTYDEFQTDIRSIENKVAFRLAGYTDKTKLNIVLDSKNPAAQNTANIFVPDENITVYTNTSSPVDSIVYSGVKIEKSATGYIVSGYNDDEPSFKYYAPVTTNRDANIVIGGTLETSVDWSPAQFYVKGQIIVNDSNLYRATSDFTSGNTFTNDNITKIPEIPTVGGTRGIIKKEFNYNIVLEVNYGTVLKTLQDVVDLLIGYGRYLEVNGFEFNYVDEQSETITNWTNAAKEFLAWSAQGWANGTSIALSPAAFQVEFKRDFTVVDDIYDNFYRYSLLDENAQPLNRKFSSILRDNNSFSLTVKNSDNGIYNVKLPLVQKEHVVIIDNETVFNDLIYQPSTGYRQERLKLIGYRSDNWNGSLNIPGFVYDDAELTEWEPWQDYQIGSLVKNKEFYYVAKYNAPGTKDFDYSYWTRLNDKPESKLITNFDYRINQFADYYDIDSDGFDEQQNKLAQHLIGYQKRDYLANIINDDVSQYKFYQGMLQDKGTMNSIDNFFNSLRGESNSVEVFEEWAVQVGKYGAYQNVEQIEIPLDESKFRESPQAIEILDYMPNDVFDTVYRVRTHELLDKPIDTTEELFPTKVLEEFTESRGYVHEDDVEYKTQSISDLKVIDNNQLTAGEYIWITDKTPNDWTVFQIVDSQFVVREMFVNTELDEFDRTTATLTVRQNSLYSIVAGDLVAITGAQLYSVYGYFEVITIDYETIVIAIPETNEFLDFTDEEYSLSVLRTVRVEDFDQYNNIAQNSIFDNQRVWIDNYENNSWAVLDNKPVYNSVTQEYNPNDLQDSSNLADIDQEFTKSISVTADNKEVYVSSPSSGAGEVFYYRRNQDNDDLGLAQTLGNSNDFYDGTESNYGESISASHDGKYLAVGVPNASAVKTFYKGEFAETKNYTKWDIVKHKETLWQANTSINSKKDTTTFSTFDNYTQIIDRTTDTNISLLSTGNPGLENTDVDHFILRAPTDMFQGSSVGDVISLKWNEKTQLNNNIVYSPWNNSVSGLDKAVIENNHTIASKIEAIITITNIAKTPLVGDFVRLFTTNLGASTATVDYVAIDASNAVVYLKDIKGVLNASGSAYVENQTTNEIVLLGDYTKVEYGFEEEFNGFWKIDVAQYNNGETFFEEGKGLVYADLFKQENYSEETKNRNTYYNISNTELLIGDFLQENRRASMIEQISSPDNLSNKFLVRVGQEFTTEIGDSFNFYMNKNDDSSDEISTVGFTFEDLNKEQTIVDIWDGYIDFENDVNVAQIGEQEFEVGDIIIDQQFALDTNLLVSETPLAPFNKAEVVHVKTFGSTQGNRRRVYIKITQGDWQLKQNVQLVRLIRERGNADIGRIRTVNNQIDYSNSVIVPTGNNIGKFLVLEAENAFAFSQSATLIDKEYYFYTELFGIAGAPTQADTPSSLNRNWKQVYNISTPEGDAVKSSATLDNGVEDQGLVIIYYKSAPDQYVRVAQIVSEQSFGMPNAQFGKTVKIISTDTGYKLYAASNYSIEYFENSPLSENRFRGNWNRTLSYSVGDIVFHYGKYYEIQQTLTPADQTDGSINNLNAFKPTSWRRIIDTNYKGSWQTVHDYRIGDIVEHNDLYYVAQSNFAPNGQAPSATNALWVVTSDVVYQNYLKPVANAGYDVRIDNFVLNNTATALAVKVSNIAPDSTVTNEIRIYGSTTSGKYIKSQTIRPPASGTEFGMSYDFSTDGSFLAISEPHNSDNGTNVGKVYLYTNTNGTYELTQTLEPPKNSVSLNFGYSLSFSDNVLSIASFAGIVLTTTIFDADETLFDLDQTEFQKVNYDPGVIYVYEQVKNKFIFAESIPYDNVTKELREQVLINANHIYVGVPAKENNVYVGGLYDYRKKVNSSGWNVSRELIQPVDLDKIQGAFLYNKRTNSIITYLDYIDPIQGKIAGPADKNINFKVPFDPAYYNVGDTADTFYWEENHVGMVWWNTGTSTFTYPYQGDINYQRDNWNELQPGATVDVCEWVETDYLPSEWDELSETTDGIAQGITGQTLYGDSQYSKKFVFNEQSQTFSEKYYYWVKNAKIIPAKTNRTLTTLDIARLIAVPRQQGYRYLSMLSSNRIVLNNCNGLVYDTDVVLAIRYSNTNIDKQNSHSAYKLITDGLDTSGPSADIELKWFDSLIGFDINNRAIPDVNLTEKQKYGVQSTPRQGMFKNRREALKEFIERVNVVLSNELVIEKFNISAIDQKDPLPTFESGVYDVKIDSLDQLSLVGTKVKQAKLEPIIINGKITKVKIIDPGRGYKTAPSYKINGFGEDARFDIGLNNLGQITTVQVIYGGKNYANTTQIDVRRHSVLVESDSEVDNKWSIYAYDNEQLKWNRIKVQSYDITKYWSYIDWYDTEYSVLTNPDYTINSTYELSFIDDQLGDIIKVNSVGTGGWSLLEKVNTNTENDYKTVGRENGTIQFKDNLYRNETSNSGFDNKSFDSFLFDIDPRFELRVILETIRDALLIKDLRIEYNQLFIATLRYILTEQNPDWFFKTSFIKVKHLAGNLDQDLTYNIDNLENYKRYIEEVKPYKTNIREFVSNFQKIETASTSVSDFDLPVYYNVDTGKVTPISVQLKNGVAVVDNELVNEYPRKNWLDNIGASITEITISNPGTEYTIAPKVEIIGNGTGATAQAYVGYGTITNIVITNKGKGYTQTPTVKITPPPNSAGTPATAIAVLGDMLARTANTTIKFDRNSVTPLLSAEDMRKIETFTGTGSKTTFDLIFPANLDQNTISILVNNQEVLASQFNVYNIKDTTRSYTRYVGQIVFDVAPANNALIEINYTKNINMLNAVDRIKVAYTPDANAFGNDIAQLMDGVDYGGVEVKSFEFDTNFGWDTKGWFNDIWDEIENTQEDEIVYMDDSSAIVLNKPLEDNVAYNVYRVGYDVNGNVVTNRRLDDPNFDTPQQTNLDATCLTLVGDGSTQILHLEDLQATTVLGANESRVAFIVRKTTSDGSILYDARTYDLDLDGGNMNYSNAKGITAEEIIVDGDSFVTPTTSKSVEELVPGQVQDTLDIQVSTLGDDSSLVRYRIFKDILNRTIYSRIDTPPTKLAKPITQLSLSIEVEDGTNLIEPNRTKNIPGVLMINKERIEYLVKDGNVLKQLRRGTLGTGVANIHPKGEQVFLADISKYVPYVDTTQSQTATNVSIVNLNFLPLSTDEFEVFVNGLRLNGKPFAKFDATVGLDSPEADSIVPADYVIEYYNNQQNARIVIQSPAILNIEQKNIVIVRKKGNIWQRLGESITETETSIGFFLRAGN